MKIDLTCLSAVLSYLDRPQCYCSASSTVNALILRLVNQRHGWARFYSDADSIVQTSGPEKHITEVYFMSPYAVRHCSAVKLASFKYLKTVRVTADRVPQADLSLILGEVGKHSNTLVLRIARSAWPIRISVPLPNLTELVASSVVDVVVAAQLPRLRVLRCGNIAIQNGNEKDGAFLPALEELSCTTLTEALQRQLPSKTLLSIECTSLLDVRAAYSWPSAWAAVTAHMACPRRHASQLALAEALAHFPRLRRLANDQITDCRVLAAPGEGALHMTTHVLLPTSTGPTSSGAVAPPPASSAAHPLLEVPRAVSEQIAEVVNNDDLLQWGIGAARLLREYVEQIQEMKGQRREEGVNHSVPIDRADLENESEDSDKEGSENEMSGEGDLSIGMVSDDSYDEDSLSDVDKGLRKLGFDYLSVVDYGPATATTGNTDERRKKEESITSVSLWTADPNEVLLPELECLSCVCNVATVPIQKLKSLHVSAWCFLISAAHCQQEIFTNLGEVQVAGSPAELNLVIKMCPMLRILKCIIGKDIAANGTAARHTHPWHSTLCPAELGVVHIEHGLVNTVHVQDGDACQRVFIAAPSIKELICEGLACVALTPSTLRSLKTLRSDRSAVVEADEGALAVFAGVGASGLSTVMLSSASPGLRCVHCVGVNLYLANMEGLQVVTIASGPERARPVSGALESLPRLHTLTASRARVRFNTLPNLRRVVLDEYSASSLEDIDLQGLGSHQRSTPLVASHCAALRLRGVLRVAGAKDHPLPSARDIRRREDISRWGPENECPFCGIFAPRA